MARKLRDKVETKNIVLVPNTKDLIEPVSSFLQSNPSYSALEQDKHKTPDSKILHTVTVPYFHVNLPYPYPYMDMDMDMDIDV